MRRKLQRQLSASAVVVALVLCLSARQPLNAAYSSNSNASAPRSLAEDLFRRANELSATLHGKPLEERAQGEYLRALDAYSQVIRLNTDNHFAAEALMKRAELQREMADGSGDSALYQQAVETLRQIVREHPHSAFVGDALIAIAQIYEENLQDLDGAIGAYRELVEYFPASVMAREARAVIARFESGVGRSGVDVIAAKGREESGVGSAQLTNVRNFSGPSYARVVIDLAGDAAFAPARIGDNRVMVRLSNAAVASSLFGRRFIVGDTTLLKRIVVRETEATEAGAASGVQIEIEVGALGDYSAFKLTDPNRIVIDLHAAAYLAKSGKAVEVEPRSMAGESVKDATTPTKPAEEVKPNPVAKVVSPKDATKSVTNPARPKLEGSEAIARAAKPRASGGQPIMTLPEITEPIVPHNPNDARNNTAGAAAVEQKLQSGAAVKCIVIDAGHGGHDTGTISPNGLREKDLTLDVARRLRSYIKRSYPEIEVVMTRDSDSYVALEQRTAIANARRADLFISVHANSSPSKAASGVETFFVSPDKEKAKTDDKAKEAVGGDAKADNAQVANRETVKEAAKPAAATVADKPQPVIASVTIGSRVAESRELARYIQSGLVRGIGAASPRTAMNRGVKHAGFVVLMGAAMPSVLAEVSFLSNPKDEALLMTGQFRERIAVSLFAGLNAYLKKSRPVQSSQK